MMQPKNQNEHETTHCLTTRVQLLKALEYEAHVYLAFTDKHSDPQLLAWYRDLLSEGERERYKSFQFTQDRDLYLLTHGLARATLSQYLEIAPNKLEFTHGPYGRPEIAQLKGNPKLRFNVSRTYGLVACLIVLSIDAGVDVEKIRKLDDFKTLSEKVLTCSEISMLRDLPESDQIEGFFALWTLKEAYAKARGTGLSLTLDSSTFYFDPTGCLRISVSAELQDISSDWQFACFRPTASTSMAVALRQKERADLRIRFFEAIPKLNGSSSLYLKQYNLEDLKDLKMNMILFTASKHLRHALHAKGGSAD